MSINIVCCINESFQIGNSKTNDLLYYIKDDLKRFKALTLDSYTVMGRNTFESLPKPLKNRTNVILTRDVNYTVSKTLTAEYDILIEHDFEKILNHYKFSGSQDRDLNIIGGNHLFAEGVHWADNLYLTLVHDKEVSEADVYFPQQELSQFKIVSREKKFDEESGLYYSFLNYERK